LSKQEAQLSQRDRAMLCVIEYFAKSLKITQGHSEMAPFDSSIDHVRLTIGRLL